MTDVWLGIETTSDIGGVALVRQGRILSEIQLPERTRHSELLLPAIEELLSLAGTVPGDIHGIAVSSGPGSYTGLRIGIASAEGLASGWNTGLKGVSTLRVLAASIDTHSPVLACIRARKHEVFAAVYSTSTSGSSELLMPSVYDVSSLDGICEIFPELIAVGNGRSELSSPDLDWASEEHDAPRSSTVAVLGAELAASDGFDRALRPVYLRGFMEKARNALS